MGTNYGPQGPQGPQEPPWQGTSPQMPPWMQQSQNEQPPPWIQQHLAQGQPTQQQSYQQYPQPPIMPPVPQKWYRTNGGIIALLILFFPVGLYLMWRYARWTKKVKWVVTGILALCVLIGNITNAATPTQQVSQAAVPAQGIIAVATKAPLPTSTPISMTVRPTPTPVLVKPTPTHTVQPPTPTPIPRPTQPPAPTPVPPLGIQFTTAVNEDVAVQTLPGAALTIKILYQCSGHYATSQSLRGTFTADSSGNMTWTWNNQSSCHGTVTATVTASLNGKSASNVANFTD